MAISEVSLSLAARSNLLSLQDTSALLATTQQRLSTGKKVNTAIDNATAFFASQSFLNRANDLSGVKEGLSSNLQTVKAASSAIDSITKIVQQAQGLATSALQTGDTASRSAYATQFDDLRDQIDALVNDAIFNGTNLLDSDDLTVKFNEDGTSTLTVTGVDATVTGLSISAAASNWASDANITAAQDDLQAALTTLRTYASGFGNNVSVIQTRQDFTSSLITSLQTASDNLVLADLNEEGANLQALQARQQLGVVALGISGQQDQAILRLF